VDYRPRFSPEVSANCVCEHGTGEYGNRRIWHGNGEAEDFYRRLAGQVVRVGMEAGGHSLRFERLLAELGHELWTGDPAQIRANRVRKQRNDVLDAEHILTNHGLATEPWSAAANAKNFSQGTKLRCTALRFVPCTRVRVWGAASRVKMNAKSAPLTPLPTHKGFVLSFSILTTSISS